MLKILGKIENLSTPEITIYRLVYPLVPPNYKNYRDPTFGQIFGLISKSGSMFHKLARKNIKIKREPIKINISDIALIDYKENIITFSVRCSKGTYIRVLGKDIAEKLKTVGSLKSLKRTNVGQFSIKDSIKIESFEAEWKSLEI